MNIVDKFMGVIAPHECLSCGVMGQLICADCVNDVFEPLPSRCYRCKKLTISFSTCASCIRQSKVANVWVRTSYSGTAKELIHRYKFERAKNAAKIIANAMNDVVPYLREDILIIPVPTATTRIRQRGYDQAELLANYIGDSLGFLVAKPVSRLSQHRQLGASRKTRLEQLQNDFYLNDSKIVKKSHIVMVDDVVTTGATIETIAKLLKQSGAKSVSAVAFAQ